MRTTSQAQLLADMLYSAYETPVLVTAGLGTILAFSHQPPELSDGIRREGILLNSPPRVPKWLESFLDPDVGLVRAPANDEAGALPRTVITIPYRGHPIGYIFALDPDQRVPDDWHITNARALVSAGLEIELQKSRASQSQLAVRSLLSPDPSVRSIGVDSLGFMRSFEMATRIRVMVAEVDDPSAHMVRLMWSGPPAGGGAWADIDDRLVIVVNEDERSSDAQLVNVQNVLQSSSTPPTVWYGIGGEVDNLAAARQSYEESLAALRVGGISATRPKVSHWDTLGSWRTLATLGRERGLRTLAPRISEMITHERPEMIEVLREYLNRNGEVDKIALELHMHRSTVYSRLKRIETKYDVNLNDAEDRLTIIMGLRLAQLYL